jgi:hypothetical protein
MAGAKRPIPHGLDPDSETACRASSSYAGPTGASASCQEPATQLVSPALKTTIEVPFSIAPGMTWDSFQRLAYDKLNAGLQEQASQLLKRGNITYREMENLVNARNASVLEIRGRLTSFGELYSEILKPAASLKTAEQLLAEKGSIEAVLNSVGRTRQVVDRIGIASRWAGPAAIVLQITLITYVTAEAPPQDRGRVAAQQIGGATLGVAGGYGGMWLGCVGGASLASGTLVIPYVGEGATGGACLVGGILGGFGIGFGAQKVGEKVGEGAYDFVTHLKWVK